MSMTLQSSGRSSVLPGRRTSATGIAFALALTASVQLTGLAQGSEAAVPSPMGVDAGSTSGYTTSAGVAFLSDRGFTGGSVYTAASSTAIAGTADDALYRSVRNGMSAYRVAVPDAATYRIDLHMAELQTGGRGKRVFDVTAEGKAVIQDLDLYGDHGRAVAVVRSFDVAVSDGQLDLSFSSASSLPASIAAIRVVRAGSPTVTQPTVSPTAPTPTVAPTQAPTTPPTVAPTTAPPTVAPTTAPPTVAPTLPPVSSSEFPTIASTGSRVPVSSMTRSGGITSSYDGQVIENRDITGNVRILHDNVTVRDSRISFTSTYGLYVGKKSNGSCPTGTLYEYVEVDGRLAAENDIPVYSPGCGWTLDHAYVHQVGRTSRMTNDATVSNSYIHSSRTGDSGAHRGAVGTSGGRNNRIINNVLLCEGTGCSAAIPMYGDFAPVDGMLVQHNLMATTGSYCAYGGSVSSKPYPNGSNVKFIDNHFSTRFMPKCGRYGPLSSFDNGVRGNERRGNVWHETGLPVSIG